MKRDLPQYVVSLKGVLYFKRRGQPTVKFAAQELGQAFYSEYAERLTDTAAPIHSRVARYTFKHLIASYTRTPGFKEKKPRTKKDYLKYLGKIEANLGHLDPRKMKRKDVIRLRDTNAERYRDANYLVQCIRIALEHAVDLGWISTNPARGVSLLKSPYENRKPWPPELILKFRQAYGYNTKQRLCFELLIGTGQRIGDVVAMKWSDIAGQDIQVTQSKTSKRLLIPMPPDLLEALRQAKRASDKLLGWKSYNSAHASMMKARKAIGATDFDIHSLRHTAASEMASLGLSDEDIMSVTGHDSVQALKIYTETPRQIARARRVQGIRTEHTQNENG